MYRVVIKHTRPNTNVDFFNPKTSPLITAEAKMYIRDTYMLTGKIIHTEDALSEDGLTLTLTSMYPDEATYNQWKSDTFVNENIYEIGRQYREANGIVAVIESAEEI